MRDLRSNTATRVAVGPFLDKTDGITPKVGLTVTSEKLTLVVDTGGVPTLVLDTAPTASGGANDMVHITGDDSGFYDLELAAADVNYVGRAILGLNDVATHVPVFHEFRILSAAEYDRIYGVVVSVPTMAPKPYVFQVNKPSTSVFFKVIDATGRPVTGKVAADFTAAYSQNKNAGTAITLSDLAAISSAWSSGGLKERDATLEPGVYRLDIPNATVATNTGECDIQVLRANCECQLIHIDIINDDVYAANDGSSQSSVDAIGTNVTLILAATEVYKKNVAVTGFKFTMRLANGDPATGKTVTCAISKDNNAFANLAANSGVATERASGWYEIDISAGELNGDEIGFKATATGCQQRDMKIRTQS